MATVHKNAMHGLSVYITDIRNCQSKDKEEKRVSKELAKIRKKFKENKDIDGYNRRKYVSKLVYTYMLGYEIDFGFMEAVALLSSIKFQEKLTGYLAISLFIHENHEMIPLIIQALLNDLQSRTELHQILALTAISNIGGKEMAESLAPIVIKLLTAKNSKPLIRKKSALALLRLWRRNSDIITPDMAEKLILLLDESDHGVLTSTMSLLLAVVQKDPAPFELGTKKAINILTKVVINRDFPDDYLYYNIANPWLQVKLLRFLGYYPSTDDRSSRQRLSEVLRKILDMVDTAKGQTVNHKNSLNAVLFEAIDLTVSLNDDRELIKKAVGILGRFISSAKETNIRYLGLKGMSKLARMDTEISQLVKKYQETVILALKDPDVSIRKRALDLLYEMCDSNNVKVIVGELLNYLTSSDFGIREELVLKIAILAEKFATHYSWYVDVILQLISLSGDFVSDAIWFRVVQIVTNHEDIQEYAAKTVLNALKQSNCHETAVKVGGYILGEFGELIAEKPESSAKIQFQVLQTHFPTVSFPTKALLLSTYVKFVNLYPNELGDTIREIFRQYQRDFDVEVQQRSFEYYKLTVGSQKLLQTVWEMMPPFPNKPTLGTSVEESESSQPQGQTSQSSASPSTNPISSLSAPSSSFSSSQTATKKSSLLDDLLDLTPSTGSTVNLSSSGISSSSVPPSKSGLDDIFGLSSSLPSTSQNSAYPNISQNTSPVPQNPLLSGFGTSSPIPSTSSSPSSFTKGPGSSLSLDKINLGDSGILYEDQNIQIGFKSEFTKNSGRLMLYYGNKTNSQITSFSPVISQISSLSFNVQAINPIIEPKTQLPQLINVTSLSPFSGSPTIAFNFVANGKPVTISATLPIALCKFTEPSRLKGPEFFQFWNKVGANPPFEQQVIIKSPIPINMEYLTKLLSSGFKLAVLQGVDPNMNNLVCAGTFQTSTVQTPVAVRIETNPQAQMYRCTVRTTDGTVSQGFKELLNSQLS